MNELLDIRHKLDQIDETIVALFKERMDLCDQVGEYKIKTGKKVFDRTREREKLLTVSSGFDDPLYKKGIQETYTQLMSLSRKLQYRKLVEAGALGRLPFIEVDSIVQQDARIVFQGAPGSYGQAAMEQYFGKDCNQFHVESFREVMDAIEEGSADYAVLPIENSSMGSVIETYDLLVDFENYIVGEIIIHIDHTISGLPGSKLSDIKRVYSKAEALMQVTRFLEQHTSAEQISVVNTAVAASKIKQDNDPTQAAICSAYAAEKYGLEILQDHISDDESNSTRFIIITNQKVFQKDAKKISICFEVSNESGSLYHLLSHFIFNDLNMTRIESRPVEGSDWEYRFFVDFEGNLADASVKNAIRGLREEAKKLKILGNY